jgi:hypothetical protein
MSGDNIMTEHRILGCLVSSILMVCGCSTSDTPISLVSAYKPFPQHIDQLFVAIPNDPPADLFSHEGQSYMQMLPAVGREDVHAAQKGWPMRASLCKAKLPSESAVADIVEAALGTTVVIVNEAHDRPRHRDFIRQIAVELKPLGYSVFAAETFDEAASTRSPTPYPLIQDGFYSNEPVFGDLLRELMELGFRFESYEHSVSEVSEYPDVYARASIREEGQASNLQQIVSLMNEGERLLVHVGFSHASEVPIRSFGEKKLAWMASRLKEKTGINPVTIDQTDCSTTDDQVLATYPSARHEPGQFDIVIGHPELEFKQHRPAWRQSGDISPVAVPAIFRSDAERVIVEVRPLGEPADSVPIDRLMLWPSEKIPLLLRPGEYRVIAYFATSNTVVDGHLTVEEP